MRFASTLSLLVVAGPPGRVPAAANAAELAAADPDAPAPASPLGRALRRAGGRRAVRAAADAGAGAAALLDAGVLARTVADADPAPPAADAARGSIRAAAPAGAAKDVPPGAGAPAAKIAADAPQVLQAIANTDVAQGVYANRGAETLQAAAAVDQPGCMNPKSFGPIRNWQDRSQCLNVDGDKGRGNVNTYYCDELPDQIWYLCEDGSIRNERSQFCLANDGWSRVFGSGNVAADSCNGSQKWEVINKRNEVDATSGIEQTRFQLKDVTTGKCLDVAGTDGSGEVGLWDCSTKDDQYWHFRHRGGIVAMGALENRASNQCMDPSGTDGTGHVSTGPCKPSEDQIWTLYENGELVNEKSNMCLDAYGNDGHGKIGTYFCLNKSKQMWEKTDKHDGLFVLRNKLSDLCVDVHDDRGHGRIGTWECESTNDQDWKVVPTDEALAEIGWVKWGPARGSWHNVACHVNGAGLSRSVEYAYSTSESYTNSFSVSVGLAIEAAFKVDTTGLKVTTSFQTSYALSKAWTKSKTTKTRTDVKCGAGEACLWQFEIDLDGAEDESVEWVTQYTHCTTGHQPPACGPFDVLNGDGVCVSQL